MLKEEELNSIKSMDSFCRLEIEYDDVNDEYKHITINGVELDYSDFGRQYDTDPYNAPDYGCGNMRFIPDEHISKSVLNKYNITEEEARKIQERLNCLSFGYCGWCI